MNLLAERSQLSLKPNNQLPSSVVMFGKSTKELSTATMKDSEKCLDPHLWRGCAGAMVQMPSINSKVFYFPQGHGEHAQSPIDFGTSPKIPPFILSRVLAVKFMADPDTDEVFAKIHLVPVGQNELGTVEDEGIGLNGNVSSDLQEKTTSFAKTLTQSDANNGGGFSVPRYCAETIFPRLDYSAEPPVQTVFAKDVHGEIWKFRHIYRGTPRRHLLTTGWSAFVNHKKLVAGDSIVFLRTENGELCVGIRRAKRGIRGGSELPCGWSPPTPSSVFMREEEKRSIGGSGYGGSERGEGRVKGDSVIEAARLAASGQAFEVLYYPRAGTPEFCVKAESVRGAITVQWCPGMRFKMAFETEDSSRISWFMGTISSVQVADPIRWPNSPWRLLQVSWEEPDLLQNVKRVNPWLVELVSNMPMIHLPPFSPPRKKPRISDFPLNISPFPKDSSFAGIQGARHAEYNEISLSDLHLNKLQSELFQTGFSASSTKFTTSLYVSNDSRVIDNDISCSLTIGSPTSKSCSGKRTSQLVLFGQTILTGEEHISAGTSSGYGSSDVHNEKGANSSSSPSSMGKNSSSYFEYHGRSTV